jgi:hypothetical protein
MNRSVEGQDKPGLVILKRKSGIKSGEEPNGMKLAESLVLIDN